MLVQECSTQQRMDAVLGASACNKLRFVGGIGENLSRPDFTRVISVLLRKAIAVCVVLILPSGSAWSDAVPPGFIEGHLKIASLGAVEPSDAMPRQTVTAEKYAEYPLMILSQDEKKEIARVTPDGNGNYRTALPPGNYILDVQDRVAKRLRAKPRPFTVVSNQIVRVDMNV